MQCSSPQNQAPGSPLFPPPRSPLYGDHRAEARQLRMFNTASTTRTRPRPHWPCSPEYARLSTVQVRRLRLPIPGDKSRRQAHKEILRRALMPPIRRLSLRRWNFRPTPSRLSNMCSVSDEIL